MTPENKLPELPSTAFTRISKEYVEVFPLRALIQFIPFVGSPIDALLAGKGAEWQYERLELFIKSLNERLTRLEASMTIQPIEVSEGFFDFTRLTFQRVVNTRSRDKIRRFTNIFCRQVAEPHPWDEAESATNLLEALTDTHLAILKASLTAPITGHPFDELRVVSTLPVDQQDKVPGPLHLRLLFPDLPLQIIRLHCSDLVARGLMHDEGVGRMAVKAMQYLVVTDLAQWLFDWIEYQDDA